MRVWTTDTLPANEQFPFWREVLCEAFTALDPVVPRERRHLPFASTVRKKEILGISIADVASRAQTVNHGAHEVTRCREDFFFLNLQLSGELVSCQDGRVARLRPGDFCLVDTTRPYALRFSDWHTLSIRIPRHVLLPRATRPEAFTSVRFSDDGGMGTVLGDFVRSLRGCPEDLPPSAQEALISTLVDLLAGSVNPSTDVSEASSRNRRLHLRNSVRRYIDARIEEPSLDTGTIARHFRVSPRYLQKLFEEDEQTLSATIMQARLRRVAADLRCDRYEHLTISEIISRWGFGDFSSFCRAFRRHHGMSAQQFRVAQRS